MTTTTTSNNTATATIFGAITLGFVVGMATTTMTAIGTYLWYYRRYDNNNNHDRNSKNATDATTTVTHTTNHHYYNDDDHESDESFLSAMVRALWHQINAVAVVKLQTTCQPIFQQLSSSSSSSSVFLRNLRFTHISLGHIPIRFDHVVVRNNNSTNNGSSSSPPINPVTKQKYIQIQCDVVWDGECDIQLHCAMGPFGIRAIKFRGTILIDGQPLVDTTSLIAAVQYTFLQPPELYISDFTGIAQMADVQVIKDMIQTSILQSITETMVLPVRTVLRMSSTEHVSFLDIYQPPIGLIRITLLQGYGFDSRHPTSTSSTSLSDAGVTDPSTMTNWFRDVPDIYCTMQIGGGCSNNNTTTTPWTSSVIPNTTNPIWTTEDPRTTNFESIVYDTEQIVTITCYDNNTNTEDDVFGLQSNTVLGVAKITVSELLFHTVHAIPLQQYITTAHSSMGTRTRFTGAYLQVQSHLYPFVPDVSYLQPPPSSSSSSSYTPIATVNDTTVWNPPDEPDAICGLLTVLIGQAYDVPIASEQTS